MAHCSLCGRGAFFGSRQQLEGLSRPARAQQQVSQRLEVSHSAETDPLTY